uniref:Uncharacterized protein n=1 Tax=Anguilla anguilla TaxID=7936 RepID=A0A0E9UPJ8_ANGAN
MFDSVGRSIFLLTGSLIKW